MVACLGLYTWLTAMWYVNNVKACIFEWWFSPLSPTIPFQDPHMAISLRQVKIFTWSVWWSSVKDRDYLKSSSSNGSNDNEVMQTTETGVMARTMHQCAVHLKLEGNFFLLQCSNHSLWALYICWITSYWLLPLFKDIVSSEATFHTYANCLTVAMCKKTAQRVLHISKSIQINFNLTQCNLPNTNLA